MKRMRLRLCFQQSAMPQAVLQCETHTNTTHTCQCVPRPWHPAKTDTPHADTTTHRRHRTSFVTLSGGRKAPASVHPFVYLVRQTPSTCVPLGSIPTQLSLQHIYMLGTTQVSLAMSQQRPTNNNQPPQPHPAHSLFTTTNMKRNMNKKFADTCMHLQQTNKLMPASSQHQNH